MRCFNHGDVEAVGICKHCSKAICHSCANDLGVGLACRGVHEAEVTSISQTIARSVRAQAVGGIGRYATALFYVGLGSAFIGYEVLFAHNGPGFGAVMGAMFIAYGLYAAFVVRRAFQS